MNKRKEIEKQIEMCEKKKLWLEYQVLRQKVVEYSNDKKEAMKVVNRHRNRLKPLEEFIDKAKREISELEKQKLSAVSVLFIFYFNQVIVVKTDTIAK